ncbi:hypothetical protein [Candidatus Entotheonella palauensis]|uniref:hypothetical protein n=1 Tax=Candidatus Entotheonella palauensis TaxID=93172 RepID=UPI000B7CDBB4|nr:hypothetical protein [Candidatus Entotheonella palauensis]
MPSVMADHDVEGQVKLVLQVLMSEDWLEFWLELSYEIESFERLGILPHTADMDLWRLCQARGIVLITGNRNSLSIIPRICRNRPDCRKSGRVPFF